MKHITDKLESWLADELSARETAMVEEHLAACPECSSRAQELQQIWLLLGTVGESTSKQPSIWPDVRLRTLGDTEHKHSSDWFFGGAEALRAGLAATAVAAGLALAFILPAGQQISVSDNVVAGLAENSDMEWLTESTIFDSDSGGFLDDLWLGTGLEKEGGGS